jgi:metallophosphoesterase (TIGR03767 family)
VTTDRSALHGAVAGNGGYRTLVAGPGEAHVRRSDLAAGDRCAREVLLTVAHLSDLHVCDAQSPARVEFLDRWADPDSPVLDELGEVGTYRAHEMLTMQVVDACVRAVNAVAAGPVGGAPVDVAICTGDNIDNAQANELGWYLALLEGGHVHPDSGDLTRYEGVADDDIDDERYWHPSPAGTDLPRSQYGFPSVPGLLDAVRRPFDAAGLAVPWLAVHGNHDRLIQGTVPGVGAVGDVAVAAAKPIALPEGWGAREGRDLLAGFEACDPAALEAVLQARMRAVTPDAGRRTIGRDEFVAAHFGCRASPPGHGFAKPQSPASDVGTAVPHYRFDHGEVSLLVLDTVNHHGGWEGSLDRPQFDWLAAELASADARRRYVVIVSHHPVERLINPSGGGRVLGDEVDDLFAAHPCVVLWLAGHTHESAVAARASYWQVVAPSLIDWPQQARIVELLRADGELMIAATMLDHAGAAPWDGSIDSIEALAGLSRELAANDWQWRGTPLESHPRAGRVEERNVVLALRDPWA